MACFCEQGGVVRSRLEQSPLESPTFEMQAGCAGLRKSVVFVQPADAIALLQINGGTDADVRIVITPHTPAR